MALRREEVHTRAAEAGRSWIRVTQADRAALEDYIAEATGLGC